MRRNCEGRFGQPEGGKDFAKFTLEVCTCLFSEQRRLVQFDACSASSTMVYARALLGAMLGKVRNDKTAVAFGLV